MNTNFITKLFFSLVALLGTQHITAKTYGQTLPTIDPTKVEFALDIHDVIVKKVITAMIGDSVKIAQKRKKLKSKNPALHTALKNLDKQKGSTSEAYVQMCLAHGATKLANLYRKRASKQKLIKGMKKLIEELFTMGYTMRPCSNIGPLCFQDLQLKHWDAFCYFKLGTVADYSPNKEWIIKPNPRFYKMHEKKFNTDGTKKFIFIDDKLKNVCAARKAGWVGLQFTSVEELRKDLRKLRIMVKKK